MKTLVFLGLLLGAVGLSNTARAIDFTPTGAQLEVRYVEPTINKDGTPLDDLDHTNVYWQVSGQPENKSQNIAATSPAGGGNIITNILVPVPADMRVTVTVSATATDISGNESPRSQAVTKSIDRLAPAAPQ